MRIRTEPYPVASLSAGDYYIGDPCYVFPDAEWEDWIERGDSDDYEELVAGEVLGRPVAACGLVSGIGDITDQDGFEYVEDSGLIGAVPVEFADVDEDGDDSMRLVSFPEDFDVYASTTMIHIGHLRIDVSEDFDDREDEMDDLADSPATVPAYEVRATKKDSTWVVPRRRFNRRELGIDIDDLDGRIAEGTFGDGLAPPIAMRQAQVGAEGDLLRTKGSNVKVASKRLVAALTNAGLTGFSTFEIDVQDTDLGDRYVGFVVHRVLGGTDVYAPFRSEPMPSFMINQRAMDALESAGVTDFRVIPADQHPRHRHASQTRV